MSFFRFLYPFFFLLGVQMFTGCTRPISLAEVPLQPAPGQDSAVRPPLVVHEKITLAAAPVEKFVCYRSTLIFASRNGRINAWHPDTGLLRGKIRLEANAEPVLAVSQNGLLVVGDKFNRSNLSCYDLQSGQRLWQQQAGVIVSPPVITDSSIYLLTRFRQLKRYDLKTGVKLWVYLFPGQAVAPPVIAGRHVIFATEKGEAFSVTRFDGELAWQQNVFDEAVLAAPLVHGDAVFLFSRDGRVAQLSRQSGSVQWQKKIATGQFRHSAAYADSTLFLTSSAGEVIAFDLRTRETAWVLSTPMPAGSGPVVHQDVLYFSSMDRHLYSVDITSGEIVQKVKLAGRGRTRPVFCGPFLATGSEDRYVFILGPEANR